MLIELACIRLLLALSSSNDSWALTNLIWADDGIMAHVAFDESCMLAHESMPKLINDDFTARLCGEIASAGFPVTIAFAPCRPPRLHLKFLMSHRSHL